MTYVKPYPPTHTHTLIGQLHRAVFREKGTAFLYNTGLLYCIQMVPTRILVTQLNAVNNLLVHSFTTYFNIILPNTPNHPSAPPSGFEVKYICNCNTLRYVAYLPAINSVLHLYSLRATSFSSICLFHQPLFSLTISSPKALKFLPSNEPQDMLKKAKNVPR